MTSNEIRNAFADAGIKVRVKSIAHGGFRVCTTNGSAHTDASQSVLASIGCTTATGKPGGIVNAAHEIFTKAPGYVRRV